jgi:hypothetical protein
VRFLTGTFLCVISHAAPGRLILGLTNNVATLSDSPGGYDGPVSPLYVAPPLRARPLPVLQTPVMTALKRRYIQLPPMSVTVLTVPGEPNAAAIESC